MCIGSRDYGRAREWARKSVYLSLRSSMFVNWDDRLRLRAASLSNLAAIFVKRRDESLAPDSDLATPFLRTAVELWNAGAKEGAELGALATDINLSNELANAGAHELALDQAIKALEAAYVIAGVAGEAGYDEALCTAVQSVPIGLHRTIAIACYCAGRARALLGDDWPPQASQDERTSESDEDGTELEPEPEPEEELEPQLLPKTAKEWFDRACYIAEVALGARDDLVQSIRAGADQALSQPESSFKLLGCFFVAYTDEVDEVDDEGEEY